MSEKIYRLTINERQAQTISKACEMLARLGMGQLDDALRELPMRGGVEWERWHADVRHVGRILSAHMPGNIDGHSSHLGISSERVSEDSQIAWDLYQVIRHRVAWDRAIAEGKTDGTVRAWDKGMMGVHFDEPMTVSAQPLGRIESAE